MDVEEYALTQDAKIKWLQQGNFNSHYFHQVFKAHKNNIRINCLLDASGYEVTDEERIQSLIKGFYMELPGTSTS